MLSATSVQITHNSFRYTLLTAQHVLFFCFFVTVTEYNNIKTELLVQIGFGTSAGLTVTKSYTPKYKSYVTLISRLNWPAAFALIKVDNYLICKRPKTKLTHTLHATTDSIVQFYLALNKSRSDKLHLPLMSLSSTLTYNYTDLLNEGKLFGK